LIFQTHFIFNLQINRLYYVRNIRIASPCQEQLEGGAVFGRPFLLFSILPEFFISSDGGFARGLFKTNDFIGYFYEKSCSYVIIQDIIFHLGILDPLDF